MMRMRMSDPYNIVYNNDKKRIIEFVLEDSDRPDMITVYDQGCKIRESKRLKVIKVNADSNLIRKYVLNYTFNGRSLLSSITQYAPNGSHLPNTTFEYQSIEKGWEEIKLVDGTPLMKWAAWANAKNRNYKFSGFQATEEDEIKRDRLSQILEVAVTVAPELEAS